MDWTRISVNHIYQYFIFIIPLLLLFIIFNRIERFFKEIKSYKMAIAQIFDALKFPIESLELYNTYRREWLFCLNEIHLIAEWRKVKRVREGNKGWSVYYSILWEWNCTAPKRRSWMDAKSVAQFETIAKVLVSMCQKHLLHPRYDVISVNECKPSLCKYDPYTFIYTSRFVFYITPVARLNFKLKSSMRYLTRIKCYRF